jgi:hypothetical protein
MSIHDVQNIARWHVLKFGSYPWRLAGGSGALSHGSDADRPRARGRSRDVCVVDERDDRRGERRSSARSHPAISHHVTQRHRQSLLWAKLEHTEARRANVARATRRWHEAGGYSWYVAPRP